jgi:uncharacterized membrane protein
MMPLFGEKQDWISREAKEKLLQTVRELEQKTSGEIRIYIEGDCPVEDPMLRCRELFGHLGMHKTRERNAVLLYIATQDRKFALFGDEGIYKKAGPEFWEEKGSSLVGYFSEGQFAVGIEMCIRDIGEALASFFPPLAADKNELPDDIVFGKF